jgi:hypothetical protein
VDTKAEDLIDVPILPSDQGYAVLFEKGTGPEKFTEPSDLDPPGGNDGTNGNNGADDVIDKTISVNPLPSTGGPPLLGLAIIPSVSPSVVLPCLGSDPDGVVAGSEAT